MLYIISVREIKLILSDLYPDIILDDEQYQIVINSNQNMIVIAGAGSGKTTTMVAKVKYLVEEENVNPKEILFLSFTKDTIRELQEQLWERCNIQVDIMTFHKLANIILKMGYYHLDILTDMESVIRELVEEEAKQDIQFRHDIQYLIRKYSLKNKQELIHLITAFLERKRIRGIDTYEMQKQRYMQYKTQVFLDVYHKIERKYDRYLLRYHKIDFYNMIIEATELIKIGTVKLKYKYIIVDEYQDISMERFYFIEEIRKQCCANIIVVGDDWQSIYAFSGSQISLFYLFTKLVPEVKTYYLSNTYRNSQELINIAGKFIMKDSSHISKKLLSKKHLPNPVQMIYYTPWNFQRKLLNVIRDSASISEEILILSRYQHDIHLLDNIHELIITKYGNIQDIRFPKLRIQFLTVHAAKGLGYDNVVILNMRNAKYGFPTKVKDNAIMSLLNDKQYNQDAEERRLFYVALTRSKNYVYLMVPFFQASIYMKELKKDFH